MLNVKTILNPDGAEYKRGKWNFWIKKFLKISESYGLRYASSVIADSLIIQNYIKNTFNINSYLIEYGGDNSKFVPMSKITERRYCIKSGNYAFKVCRIESENNLDLILEAFSKFNYQIIVVGNWKLSQYGFNLRSKYSVFSNLILLDPIYDQITLDELRSNCRLYIHGHSVGGTNPSLVEAMNLSLCCLVYDVDYNRETTENSAIYFDSVDSILINLNELVNNESKCKEIGSAMFDISIRRYRWESIITKYNEVISDLFIQP